MTPPRSFLAANYHRIALVSLFCALVCVGCGESSPPSAAPPTPAPYAGDGPPTPHMASPPPEPTLYKASEDHTAKGMKAAAIGEGAVSTPAKVYLRIPDQLVFGQVRQALGFYRAANGDYPKTQEEFDREIITANNLRLPELPSGSRYVYRAEDGELLIEETPTP